MAEHNLICRLSSFRVAPEIYRRVYSASRINGIPLSEIARALVSYAISDEPTNRDKFIVKIVKNMPEEYLLDSDGGENGEE